MCKKEETQENHAIIPGSARALGEQQQPQKLSNKWGYSKGSPGLSLFPPMHLSARPERAGPVHRASTASRKKWETLAYLTPAIFSTSEFAGV